ncbi:hypothetical protein HK405_013779, partial [Cladochytrium tenue]
SQQTDIEILVTHSSVDTSTLPGPFAAWPPVSAIPSAPGSTSVPEIHLDNSRLTEDVLNALDTPSLPLDVGQVLDSLLLTINATPASELLNGSVHMHYPQQQDEADQNLVGNSSAYSSAFSLLGLDSSISDTIASAGSDVFTFHYPEGFSEQFSVQHSPDIVRSHINPVSMVSPPYGNRAGVMLEQPPCVPPSVIHGHPSSVDTSSPTFFPSSSIAPQDFNIVPPHVDPAMLVEHQSAVVAPLEDYNYRTSVGPLTPPFFGGCWAASGQEGQSSEPSEGYEPLSGAIHCSAARGGPSELDVTPEVVPKTEIWEVKNKLIARPDLPTPPLANNTPSTKHVLSSQPLRVNTSAAVNRDPPSQVGLSSPEAVAAA